jgi:hypothetical protein
MAIGRCRSSDPKRWRNTAHSRQTLPSHSPFTPKPIRAVNLAPKARRFDPSGNHPWLALVVDAHRARRGAVGERGQEIGQLRAPRPSPTASNPAPLHRFGFVDLLEDIRIVSSSQRRRHEGQLRAERAPGKVASGRTGVRAIAAIALRARRTLPRPKRYVLQASPRAALVADDKLQLSVGGPLLRL